MADNRLKVGATIRFLNAVGGGRVARITKDTAWVEDEDGFEIPTPIDQCVVVEQGDTFMPAYKPPTFAKHPTEIEEGATSRATHRPTESDQSIGEGHLSQERKIPKPHTFLPASGEVDAYLAYLPIDLKRLGSTAYETYLINDSKYSLYYVYSSRRGITWHLRAHGVADPDSQVFLEELEPTDLNDLERINVQLIALADNPGIYQGTYAIEQRLDTKKFFKLHSFVDNDFFEDKAWVLDLVRKSKALDTPLALDTSRLATAMQTKGNKEHTPKVPHSTAPQPKPDEPLVVDLHIEELLDSTAGMGNAEILQYQMGKFNEVMQTNLSHRGRKLIFIHGKGEGVLRNKIIAELRYRYKGCRWQDASFREYSYGATQVTIG